MHDSLQCRGFPGARQVPSVVIVERLSDWFKEFEQAGFMGLEFTIVRTGAYHQQSSKSRTLGPKITSLEFRYINLGTLIEFRESGKIGPF